MKKLHMDVRKMCELSLLIALELVMGFTPLGYLQLGFIAASLLSIPVAIGAIILGPVESTVLGLVFGLISFGKGFTSTGLMTQAMFASSIPGSFIVTVGGRVMMGACTGLLISALKKRGTKTTLFHCIVGSLAAPLLNTVFYMGLLMILFYHTDYIQGLIQTLGISNPFLLVFPIVGVQAFFEIATCCVISTTVSKTLLIVLGRK